MRIINSFLGITLFLVFIVHLKAQEDSPEEIVLAHNKARAEVGVSPLRWDEKLAAYARNYANKRKDDCAKQHSGGPYGENFSWGYGSMTIVEAVKRWVNHKSNYNYESNTCVVGKLCGLYTQVVWRSTEKVGCAKVKCSNNGYTFVTCNYDPPGNYVGQKPY